eukprot:126790-Pleurochrysis_carterae.AAC.4
MQLRIWQSDESAKSHTSNSDVQRRTDSRKSISLSAIQALILLAYSCTSRSPTSVYAPIAIPLAFTRQVSSKIGTSSKISCVLYMQVRSSMPASNCSSCWDELGTLENRLATAMWNVLSMDFGVSSSMQNDLTISQGTARKFCLNILRSLA